MSDRGGGPRKGASERAATIAFPERELSSLRNIVADIVFDARSRLGWYNGDNDENAVARVKQREGGKVGFPIQGTEKDRKCGGKESIRARK